MKKLELRHFSYMGIADTTFSIYKRHFNLFFAITAIFFVIPIFIQKLAEWEFGIAQGYGALIREVFWMDPGYRDYYTVNEISPETALGCWILTVVVHMCLNALYAGPIILLTTNILFNKEVNFRSAFRIRAINYLRILLASIGYFVTLILCFMALAFLLGYLMTRMMFSYCPLIGCFVLFIPISVTLYLGIRWSLYMPAIVLEGWAGRGAVRRSTTLVRGKWWWSWRVILGVVVIQFLITVFSGYTFSLLNELLLNWNPRLEVISHTITSAGLTLVHVFIRPLIFIALTLLFYDLKVQKEAYDLEVMVQKF